ncbi:hypothetical protein FRACYDRAFT_247246 [Fragilariopsis cylindrus CCMP1102]|uniref:Pentacotripeptide-repeat region of PRORP domain-containing protein n=1 Tax=Fragilariopsis cylindrus CCMP1102 TaxID=635003 RepID=A0A1E7EXP9_9STRA|nr:hypothetical protein FRACYDRAFT_247246 [Fragilariopsis cylindrus CCMP1102]|eukprot:OEU10303.1 hypothetical protein FRACYDRAFT_247246 [Fragilariopsis cylindrus CCMP1102]
MTSRMRKPTIANITKLTSSTTRLLFAVLFLTLILPLLMIPKHNQPADNNNAALLVSAFTSTTRTTKSHKVNIRQPHSSSSSRRQTLKLFVVKDENQQQKQPQRQRQEKQQQQQELRRSNEQKSDEAKVEKVEIKEEEEVDDIQSLRLEIRMWSQIKAPHGPKEAEKVLRKMIQLYSSNEDSNVNEQQQEKNSTPIHKEEAEVVQGGQNQSHPQRNHGNLNIKKNSYNRPYVDVIDCNQVINAYSKSRNDENAPQYALQILKDMITLSSSNKKSKSGTISSNLVPNVVTYNSVINGYAQKGNFVGASKVFQLQIQDYKQNNNTNAKPNVRSFNTMINACSKHITLNNARSNKSIKNKSNNNNKDFSSGGSGETNNNNNNNNNSMPEIAEKLLATLQEWYTMGEIDHGADTITYSAVINCWSKSDTTDGPQRALDLLHQMIRDQNIAPNTITYNSVMDAYARQGNILGATNVFQMMQLQSTNTNNRGRR